MEVKVRRNTRRTSPGWKSFLFLAVFLVAGGLIFGYFSFVSLLDPVAPDGSGAKKVITVPRGATSEQIAGILEKQGLIRNSNVFRVYAIYRSLDSRLQAGEYNISTEMSTPEIVGLLARGETTSSTFTVPEGFTVKQIADRLAEKKLINREKFMELAAGGSFKYEFLKDLPEGPERLEGFLFPDTYRVTARTTEKDIIDMMLARFDKEAKKIDLAGMAAKQGLTVRQAVTLASIIEREAKKDEERPKVASVFLNRIKKGWKLESCATIQYILGEPRARLFDKDLQIESPYNTYKYSGLPPGPIANPGSPSLQAAVNPADTDYMFFVVSEDGRHVFSRTLKEHNRNKAVYLGRLNSGN